jgi:hypothetical protein
MRENNIIDLTDHQEPIKNNLIIDTYENVSQSNSLH